MNKTRRRFLSSSMGAGATLAAPFIPGFGFAGTQLTEHDSDLYVISDGHLSLPKQLALPDVSELTENAAFLQSNDLNGSHFESACNLTLWKNGEHGGAVRCRGRCQFPAYHRKSR